MKDSLNRRSILKVAGATGMAGLAGCTGGDGDDGGDGGDGGGGGGGGGDTLNVLTWSGYEGVAALLEEEHDAEVNLSLISEDVEGFNQLQGGGTDEFDAIVIDNTWAIRHAEAGTIVPVDEEDYSESIDWVEQFSWPYETFTTDEVWAVPTRWGWGGMGYDEDKVDRDELEEGGYEVAWDGSYEGETVLLNWPTWTIPLVLLELGHDDPYVELSSDELDELGEVLEMVFSDAAAIHDGTSAVREDFVQGNASLCLGADNFALSQVIVEGYDNVQVMYPSDTGGYYWTEGVCLVDNPAGNHELAKDFINACLSEEGQYSICYEDAESKGAPVNEAAFDAFSEEDEQTIMMYGDSGFEAIDEILANCFQYDIPEQQDEWLDIWEEAKARAD